MKQDVGSAAQVGAHERARFNADLQQQIALDQLTRAHETEGAMAAAESAAAAENEANDGFARERHVRRQAFKNELMEVIDRSDVVFEVLDARDPENTRNPEAEQYCQAKKKPLALLLNKVDLVPRDVISRWLEFYARVGLPVVCFKCAQGVEKG